MYKEPESAWAKVVKLALQGQVTAGCSRLSEKTSQHSLRGLWAKEMKLSVPRQLKMRNLK